MTRKLKIILKLIMYFSPRFIQVRIESMQQRIELKEGIARCKRTKVLKNDFLKIIDELEFDSDVMLHTSMINVGKIQGGVKFISEKILEKVDTKVHTLLVSALPYRGPTKKYLNSDPVFDVRTAPIAMGAVNEYLATKPNARRSLHPTHSVIAIGPKAEDYISEHHLGNTPFGVNSPYYKIIKNSGKILLAGATLNNLTCIHAIEDMLGSINPVKCYDLKLYTVRCIDHEGKKLQVRTYCHNQLKGITRDLSFMYYGLVREKVMKCYPFGESELVIIDAKLFMKYYLSLLQSGRSIYGKHKVTKELLGALQQLRQDFEL